MLLYSERAESRFLLDQLLRVFLIRSGGRRGRIRCGVDDRGRTLVLVLCAPLLIVGDGLAAVVINLQEVKLLNRIRNGKCGKNKYRVTHLLGKNLLLTWIWNVLPSCLGRGLLH